MQEPVRGGDAMGEDEQLLCGHVARFAVGGGLRACHAVVVGGVDRAAEVDRHTVGAVESAGHDLADPAVGVHLRDTAAGEAGDEHAVLGVEGRVVQADDTAGDDRRVATAEEVDTGHDAGLAAGQHRQHPALVEAHRDGLVHVLRDPLRGAAVGRYPPDLVGEHVRVIEVTVRA